MKVKINNWMVNDAKNGRIYLERFYGLAGQTVSVRIKSSNTGSVDNMLFGRWKDALVVSEHYKFLRVKILCGGYFTTIMKHDVHRGSSKIEGLNEMSLPVWEHDTLKVFRMGEAA